jgi:hypothetical protein
MEPVDTDAVNPIGVVTRRIGEPVPPQQATTGDIRSGEDCLETGNGFGTGGTAPKPVHDRERDPGDHRSSSAEAGIRPP